MSTNAKKILEKRVEKAPRQPRAKKLKVDLDSMPDAIVDGRFTVPLRGRVVFVRSLDQKTAIHRGYVFGIDEARGTVTLMDETREQFFVFEVARPPVIKAGDVK